MPLPMTSIAHEEPAVYGESHIHIDIDDSGGPELGCLKCRDTRMAGYGLARTYLVFDIYCRRCGTTIVQIDKLYDRAVIA